jgi:hypothetical protein
LPLLSENSSQGHHEDFCRGLSFIHHSFRQRRAGAD